MKLTKKVLAIVMALGLIACMSAMAFAATAATATDPAPATTSSDATSGYEWVLHENSIYNWVKKGKITHCEIVRGKNFPSYCVSVDAGSWSGVIKVKEKDYPKLKEGSEIYISSYDEQGTKSIVLDPRTDCFFIDVVKEEDGYYAVFLKEGEEVYVKSHRDIGGYINPLGTDAELVLNEDGQYEMAGQNEAKQETVVSLVVVGLIFFDMLAGAGYLIFAR